MKKLLLIILSLVLFLNANAQKASVAKEWILTQIKTDSNTKDVYKIVNFNTDKSFVFSGRPIGEWTHNNKSINISAGDEGINGEWAIIKFSKSKLILEKGNTKMFFTEKNFDNLSVDNKESKVSGVWKIIDGSRTPSFIKFELPYRFSSGNEIGSKSGEWYFQKDDNSLVLLTNVRRFRGKKECKRLNDSIMVLGTVDNEIKLQKVNNTAENIELLEFPKENDSSYSTFKSSYYYDEEERPINFDWEVKDAKIDFLKSVNALTYIKSVLITDFEILDKTEVSSKVIYSEDNNQILISKLFIFSNKNYTAKAVENENIYYPLSRPQKYKELEELTLTVPSGTYECKVFDVIYDNGNTVARLYMIKNKPGVYAKIIMYSRNNYTENKKYLVFELFNIDIVK